MAATTRGPAAYQERKWSSNRFNLERMRAREVLESLVRPLVRREHVEPHRLQISPAQQALQGLLPHQVAIGDAHVLEQPG